MGIMRRALTGMSLEEIGKVFPQHELKKIKAFLGQDLNNAWRGRMVSMSTKKYQFTRLEDEKCDKIVEFRKLNKSVEEMAMELGSTTSIVAKVLNELGLSYPRGVTRHKKVTVYDREKAEQMYKEGFSLREIANEVKVPIGVIKTQMKMSKIIRINNNAEEHLNSVLRIQKQEIAGLRNTIKQQSKIISELRRTLETTLASLSEIGI